MENIDINDWNELYADAIPNILYKITLETNFENENVFRFSKYILRRNWKRNDIFIRLIIILTNIHTNIFPYDNIFLLFFGRFAELTASIFIHQGYPVHFFSTLVPTPFVAFATARRKCAAGVMVTASHNPKQDNGYKVNLSNFSPSSPTLQQSYFLTGLWTERRTNRVADRQEHPGSHHEEPATFTFFLGSKLSGKQRQHPGSARRNSFRLHPSCEDRHTQGTFGYKRKNWPEVHVHCHAWSWLQLHNQSVRCDQPEGCACGGAERSRSRIFDR